METRLRKPIKQAFLTVITTKELLVLFLKVHSLFLSDNNETVSLIQQPVVNTPVGFTIK